MGVLDINAVDKHSTDVPVGGYGAADTSSALNQGEDQQLDGDISDADVAELVPPSRSFSLARHSDISGEYSGLHPRLIIILSIFVGFIAVVIQYVLESKKQRSNTGFVSIRPGWARHRSDGWQYHEGR